MRSIAGLSGSPVVVFLNNQRIYDSKLEGEGHRWQILLLGVIRGHWHLEREFSKDSEPLTGDAYLGYSKGEKMNVGIAIVTPSHYISAILNSDYFMRKKNVERLNQENQITEDSALVETESSEVFTKEDFENALKKVSRKISLPEKEKKETSAE